MPNRRLPRAAKTLIAKMEEKYKSVKVEPVVDSADGLNVMRQVKFSPKAPAAHPLNAAQARMGPRADAVRNPSGVLPVTFSGDRLADDTTPFALNDAPEVADSEDDV